MNNFNYPYFSRDIAEFWRRWHISLTSWFKDYLYIPLGGSKHRRIRNILIIFILSGFWHGANWTFVFWGFLNAVYFLPLVSLRKNRQSRTKVKSLPEIKDLPSIIVTFTLTVFAWIFFRSETIGHGFSIVSRIFSKTLFSIPFFSGRLKALLTIFLVLIFVSIEWIGRSDNFAIEKIFSKSKKIIRWGFYYLLVFTLIIFYISATPQEFIYFQF